MVLVVGPAHATNCTVPNVGGTAEFPPPCPEGYVGPMIIDEGIPGGSILIDASIKEFFNVSEVPGGGLGGNLQDFESILYMEMTGMGSLAGFNRSIFMQTTCQTHTAPRVPGDAVQDFDTQYGTLLGDIFGDPDFDIITLVGGSGFGLPSPGHTTLTRLGPPGSDFQVDSFFDICYRIEFQGAPGSVLDGMSGATEACGRFEMGEAPVGTSANDWSTIKTLY